MVTMRLRAAKSKTKRRAIGALLLAPLLALLALLFSTYLQSQPVFKIPLNTRVLVSRRNPFASLAGPVYFERIGSSNPPKMFWEQMRRVSSNHQDLEFEDELLPMNSNYVESRDNRQNSFKVLGIPQISVLSPSFHSSGRIRDAHVKVYLWADGHGGSIMELWVMDKF